MSIPPSHLSFKPQNKVILVTPDSPCFRPPSWPPPDDWPVCMDANDRVISCWQDLTWDFSVLEGKSCVFHFAEDGRTTGKAVLSSENQFELKMCASSLLWGSQATQSMTTALARFNLLRRVFLTCENAGILASQLHQCPDIIDELIGWMKVLSNRAMLLLTLARLSAAHEQIGFTFLTELQLAHIKRQLPKTSKEDTEQTAYMPPRIWLYQVTRLREFLDEFVLYQQRIADCYNFCIDAYVTNFGSLEASIVRDKKDCTNRLPFEKKYRKNPGSRSGYVFHGEFCITAERFGILELLKKWVGVDAHGRLGVRSITTYLTLLSEVTFAYIVNFTLQRQEETSTLRADCLQWEHDPIVGDMAVITGETTKTNPDSDARWPTSPNVKIAVEAAAFSAKLRLRCVRALSHIQCTDNDAANPYLFHYSAEPWLGVRHDFNSYHVLPRSTHYLRVLKFHPRLFDEEQLRIRDEDLSTALLFAPWVATHKDYQVGQVWPIAYHQLRRTTGVNMYASDIVSNSSVQFLLKHLVKQQTDYYGQHFSHIRFNEEYQDFVIETKFEVMGLQLESIASDRYVSPLGDKHKEDLLVRLVSEKDHKSLKKSAEKGEVWYRVTTLGACTAREHCKFGGIESVSHCAGDSKQKGCNEALFDKNRKPSVKKILKNTMKQHDRAPSNSPRKEALGSEVRAMKKFLKVVSD